MKRFKAAAQRATAFVLAASMMSSAVLPTVFAAQPLNAENSVDELGNVDVADEDGTLVYPEWDDDTAEDFQDEGDTIDLSDAEFDSDGDIATLAARKGTQDYIDELKKAYNELKKSMMQLLRKQNRMHKMPLTIIRILKMITIRKNRLFCRNSKSMMQPVWRTGKLNTSVPEYGKVIL